MHPVGAHPRKSHLILHCTFVQKGVHVRIGPALRVSPLGVGCGACWLELVSMVVFECLGQRQRTPRVQPYPPPHQPKRYPVCCKCVFKQVPSGRPKAGVGPLAVSGAAASCQQSRQHEGKGRRDGRLLLSGRTPLEPQPHCMQQLFLLSYRVPWDGSGTWWGFGGPMLRDPPPSKDELSSSCTQQRTRRCTRLLRSRLPLLQWYVSVAPSRVTDSACQKLAFGCALARCLPCCAAATLSPFLLLPCPLRFGPGSLCVL